MADIWSYWPEWTRSYWWLCLPILALLIWQLYRSHQRQHNWRTVLPSSFQAFLLSTATTQQSRRIYIVIACAWLCAVLALSGPSWHTTATQPAAAPALAPLVLVIELTPNMLANDLPPLRLTQVREQVLKLLQQRDDALSAIVVYAGSAHTLVPLSNDLQTSANLLQALDPELMPVAGQRADLAIQRALNLLKQGAQGRGQILLLSTGVSVSEQNAISAALKKQQVQLQIIGVGTLAGAPLVPAQHDSFLTDTTGAVIISKLQQTSLQLLAQQTHSHYAALSDISDLATLDFFTQAQLPHTPQSQQANSGKQDQGYWFILPIVLLVAGLARRGTVLVLLVCLAPLSSFAVEWDDLWLRADQQGARLLEQQPARAAEHFSDLQWRATALFLAEDYPAAAQLFAQLDSAPAHYNRGNALALSGQFAEALKAYQQALTLDPELLAARYNMSLIEEALAAARELHTPTDKQNDPESTEASPAATETAAGIATNRTDASASDSSASTTTPAQLAPGRKEQEFSTSQTTDETAATATSALAPANQQPAPIHLESWLEQIPDNPSALLKRKFLYEQQLQETRP